MGGGPDITMAAPQDPSAMRQEMALLMEQQREQQQAQWQQRQDELASQEEARMELEERERTRIKQEQDEQHRVIAEQEALAIQESAAVVEGDLEDDSFIIDFYGALIDGQEETETDYNENDEDVYPE